MTVIAHTGHWTTQLIYAAPVLLVLALLGWSKLRSGGDAAHDEAGEEPPLDDVLDGRG